ncbi:DUF4215 domain-containing protein [Sorangium sp. So ce375]|uniref:DUF4215 domain-containing protein n=1 Tax=Sorangium sp. So ce375 TaxID=3133306 RepID=UPI003F5B6FAA
MSFPISARPRLLAAAALLVLLYACDISRLEGLDTTEQRVNTEPCPPSSFCPDLGSQDEGDPDEGDPDEGYLGAGGAPPEVECGNGVVQRPSEQCDDGNTDDEDGCTSACTLTEFSVDAVCGDGVVQTPVEQCDDGNTDDDDGCANDCLFSTVAFEYSGVVTAVKQAGAATDPQGPRDTGVQVGDTFSGIYYFDPHMHDYDGHPDSSLYSFYNAPGFFGHQAQVGPLTVTSALHAPQEISSGSPTTISLTDGAVGRDDSYQVNCSLNEVAGLPSWDVDLISPHWSLSLLSLSDPSAITSTALPDTPPDLSKFEVASVVLRLTYQATPSPFQSTIYITAELTSLTRVASD